MRGLSAALARMTFRVLSGKIHTRLIRPRDDMIAHDRRARRLHSAVSRPRLIEVGEIPCSSFHVEVCRRDSLERGRSAAFLTHGDGLSLISAPGTRKARAPAAPVWMVMTRRSNIRS
jgi:hypothetical protein